MRTAFMKVDKMFFDGKDFYKNGQGTMKGKILNLFTFIDAKGKEISQSALITSFCEMMLLSGYAFQKYVEWEEIDDNTVKGILTGQIFKVSGIFHFDEKVTFETFFERATLNPNSELITGLICGYRIEEIQNPLPKKQDIWTK